MYQYIHKYCIFKKCYLRTTCESEITRIYTDTVVIGRESVTSVFGGGRAGFGS
jgi:hypothetical protein